MRASCCIGKKNNVIREETALWRTTKRSPSIKAQAETTSRPLGDRGFLSLSPNTYDLLPTHFAHRATAPWADQLLTNNMPETPPIQSTESDLARGLAEFRQGRKALLPEFELPIDDIPKDERTEEVHMERAVIDIYQKIWESLNVDQKLRDSRFIAQLTDGLVANLKGGKNLPFYAFTAIKTASAIQSLNLELLDLSKPDIMQSISNSIFITQLAQELNNNLEEGKNDPNLAIRAVWIFSAIQSLGLKLPNLTSQQITLAISNPKFSTQLTKGFIHDFELGKKVNDRSFSANFTASAIELLNIKLPDLNQDQIILAITNPDLIAQLTKYLEYHLERGQADPDYAARAVWITAAIQNIIKYYTDIAEEKEKAEAAHKLKTAADRTGVPKRPEIKAF